MNQRHDAHVQVFHNLRVRQAEREELETLRRARDYVGPARQARKHESFEAWERIGDIEVELKQRSQAISDNLQEEARHRILKELETERASLFVSIGLASDGKEPATPTTDAKPQAETRVQRQDRRLQACETAGLNFKDCGARLPDGVGKVADNEGVTRQAFSSDVKAALERRSAQKRAGGTVHRT